MKPTAKNVKYMLRESNAIESVYDEQSLKDSYKAWKYIIEKDTLTVKDVLTVHEILMTNQPIEKKYKGDFRDVPVYIGYSKKSLPKPVIDSLVQDLLVRMNSNNNPSDAVLHHIQFENIHPFIDGNGRTGRILLNWELVKHLGLNLLVYKADEKYEKYYPIFGDM